MKVCRPPAAAWKIARVAALERGPLRLEAALAPPAIALSRGGRPLLPEITAWVREGTVHDRFVAPTEGVVARELLGFRERPVEAAAAVAGEHALDLALRLRGGRSATLRAVLAGPDHAVLELRAAGAPLRVGLEWPAAPGERLAGLGARHASTVDHAGRRIQLGADRTYTGPDLPWALRALGGIPQGDYAPAPWLQSSRGYAVWCETYGNGTRFDLDGPVRVSARAAAGPLRVHVLTGPSPAARLRRYLALTGRPALLPEWGYGFWKSRDVYADRDEAEDDVRGCAWHGIPLDALVLDSPWATQYGSWEPNEHQFPGFAAMVAQFRAAGVRTVVWTTPWVNVDSRDGQIPPDPASRRLYRDPAPGYAPAAAAGHFVRARDGAPHVGRWWMGRGSIVDFTSAAEAWWREQAKGVLALGVEGIKADDGEGWYVPEDARLHDGSTGARSAWRLGGLYRRSMQRALDEVHGPGRGVVFGRGGWSGHQATGALWGGDQASDFWSLRMLVAAGISAAQSGFSNWSHDVGGYLGARAMDRCPPELLVRWTQLGCFTPLMQAHGRFAQEPWTYDERTLALYRGYVLLHEMLVPYLRATAAAAAARGGLPLWRPHALVDPGDDAAWTVADAFGLGPSLWVAPVLEDRARSRPVRLPRGEWVEAWSGETVAGGRVVEAPAPLHAIPVWVRRGALVVTYPAAHVARGLGDTPESERPLVATLWGEPRGGRAFARLADGTRIAWRRGRWSVAPERDVRFAER